LDLDSSVADVFLVKLNSYDTKIETNRDLHKKCTDELHTALKLQENGENNSALIKTLTDSVMMLQNDFLKLSQEKTQGLRAMLSDIQFSKYVDFENRFMKDFIHSFKHRKDAIPKKMKKTKKRQNSAE
jgi:hypothetical protein